MTTITVSATVLEQIREASRNGTVEFRSGEDSLVARLTSEQRTTSVSSCDETSEELDATAQTAVAALTPPVGEISDFIDEELPELTEEEIESARPYSEIREELRQRFGT